jgi:hypothetical protein
MELVVAEVDTRWVVLLQREFLIQWCSRRFVVEIGCSHSAVGMTAALHWYLGRIHDIDLLGIAVLGYRHMG